MTAPLEVTEASAAAAPEAVTSGMGRKIEGRSLGQIAWLRLRRDKVAMGGGVVVLLLVLAAVFAPLLVKAFGSPPNEFHSNLIDPIFSTPKGRFGGISSEHLLGVEPVNGRDVFSRILYGARISLLIAFLATLLSVALGVLFGIIAGYKGGWVDTLISRTMDVFLAFPLLLFAIAARRMAYSTLGFLQFISPSIVFVLGLTVFEQPLQPAQAACFACIWLAAAIFIWDLFRRSRTAS